jgi:hypothetical protein
MVPRAVPPRRRPSFAQARAWVALVLAFWSLAAAQGISFTVQVIAVSDQQNAIDISRALLQDGYPAYVVRSTGAEGDVFRVRVGAFGNRLAAARYAAAMPGVGGAAPVPMVAEAIPSGIMPLTPRVLWQGAWSAGELRVLPWPAGIALRQQLLEPLTVARYTLVQGGEVRSLEAWWLLPLEVLPVTVMAVPGPPGFGEVPFVDLRPPGAVEVPEPPVPSVGEPPQPVVARSEATAPAEVGLLWLRDRPLWPDNWANEGPEVRDAYAASTLALVAGRLGLDPMVVAEAVWSPEGEGAPSLRTVEVTDRSGRDAGDVRSVARADAGLGPWGPPPLVADGWWPELHEGVVLTPQGEVPGEVGGSAWNLTSDGAFVRITTAAGATWRAVAGRPLWSDGRYALILDGSDLVLVDFTPR